MITVTEIYQYLEQLAPTALAAKWDNVGLLVDAGAPPTGVLFALDITSAVVEEAAALNCHLIVSHHPVIFHPLKQLSYHDVSFQLVSKKISAICMHTNLDAADGGVNDVLAELLGLSNTSKFADDCGRMGEVCPVTACALAVHSAGVLHTNVHYVDAGKPISRLAVVSGSGGSYLTEAVARGADALLTGEAGHHDAIDAKQMGVSLFVAGHYATEVPIVANLCTRVQAAFPQLQCYVSEAEQEPFLCCGGVNT